MDDNQKKTRQDDNDLSVGAAITLLAQHQQDVVALKRQYREVCSVLGADAARPDVALSKAQHMSHVASKADEWVNGLQRIGEALNVKVGDDNVEMSLGRIARLKAELKSTEEVIAELRQYAEQQAAGVNEFDNALVLIERKLNLTIQGKHDLQRILDAIERLKAQAGIEQILQDNTALDQSHNPDHWAHKLGQSLLARKGGEWAAGTEGGTVYWLRRTTSADHVKDLAIIRAMLDFNDAAKRGVQMTDFRIENLLVSTVPVAQNFSR